MQRRKFIRNTGFTLAGLALVNKSSLAAFLSDPAWNIKMLTKQIGIFTEKGGTIGFMLSTEGIIVIDSQFPDTASHLIEELKKKSEKPFRLLLNTHHHGDHTSGNITFKGLVEHVVAHENSKANQERVAREQKKEEQQLYPDITYGNDGWSQTFDKEKIRTYYFGAGHTNGDSIIHFEEANIVHLGDLLFNRRHPYIDKSAGANISNWIKLLDKTASTFDKKTKYICGHAGEGYDILVKKDDLEAYRDYLGNVLKLVGDQLKAGKTKDEILKTTEIPGSPEWKGAGIERPLNAAIQELAS
ncbi:MAG: MBL fold metallo-hydrolase [Ferruginibacter sp.]